MIIIEAPAATGRNTNSKPFAPITAMIGFAPAGGWTVFVTIIIKIASPTERPMLREDIPSNK